MAVTLLKNAKIYDGTGNDAFTGSVLFENDRILEVGDVDESKADLIYNLKGKSLSSGFIDEHSHNDWFAIKEDPLPYFEPFLRQGMTTFVTGNCGLSVVGFEKDSPYSDKVGGGLFGFAGTTGKYSSIKEYAAAADGHMPCNMALLAGHCTARTSVAGYENRKLTPDEEKRMLGQLENALKDGAAGLSLGLMYEPGVYADVTELRKVAELCAKYDKPLTIHPRAESKVSMSFPGLFGRSHLLRAVDEIVEMTKDLKVKVQYSHAIFVGRRSFGAKEELLKILADLRAKGIDARFDIYNETKGVSVITVILPGWYRGLSAEEKKSPWNRLKLWAMCAATSLMIGFGYDDIEVAYIGPGYEQYEGKTVAQLARENGKSNLSMYLELCEKSDFCGRVNMGPYSTEEIIHEFEKDPNCLYMTDAWVEDHGIQNPAIYDCFPKFLQDSLTGKGDTMPATVRRMTGATADRFALKERGYVKPGYFADFTVFDEDELRAATPDQTKSFGIEKVFINGELVLDGETMDAEKLKTTGRILTV